MKKLTVALITMAVIAIPQTASASIFFSPDSASATNTNIPGGGVDNLINLTGLSSPVVTLDNIETVLHSDGINEHIWRGSSTALPITLTFNFNSSQRIDYIGLWQGGDNREGTRDFNLTFWDGPNGSGTQIGSIYADVLDTGLGGNNSIPLHGRVFDIGTRSEVRSITMEIVSVAHLVNPHVHLGEFMVADAANVLDIPEPSSSATLLLGAVLCVASRVIHRAV